MKALKYAVSFVLGAGLAFTASCGGSTEGNDDSAAGKSAGGASNGSAGRPATPGGGTSSGFAGTLNNPDCPAAVPADATACTLTGIQSTCAYSGMSCRCARVGGGGMIGGMAGAASSATREWQCNETLVCPATKPTAGDACTPAQGSCQYSGMGSCSCSQQTSQWSCRGGTIGGGGGAGGAFTGFGGAFTGFGGAFTGFGGAFTGGGGRFNGGGGTSSGTAGATGSTACPATKPAADSACTGSDACPYTGGGCVCVSDKWSCL